MLCFCSVLVPTAQCILVRLLVEVRIEFIVPGSLLRIPYSRVCAGKGRVCNSAPLLLLLCFDCLGCWADHIIADEFSGELSEGMAYVAGHDDDNRPVLVRLLQLGINVWSETGLALTVRIFDFLADVQNQAG